MMAAAHHDSTPLMGNNGGPPFDVDTDDIKMTWIKLDIADFKRGIKDLDYEIRGFYITILVEMYDSKGKLPNDALLLARRLGTTARVIRRVLALLLTEGKIYVSGDWLRNQRCDEEREKLIAEYCRRHQAAVEREQKKRLAKQAEPQSENEVSAKFAGSFAETSPKLSGMSDVQTSAIRENFLELDGNSSTKTTNDQPELWSDRAQSSDHKPGGESRSKKKEEEKNKKEIVDLEPVSGREFWAKALAPPGGAPSDHNVKFENGKLELLNGFRAEWLERFGGDEERLDLAVTTAAAYVQPFGFKSLDVQVSAQLARHLADKRDKDERYANAAKAPRAGRSAKPQSDENEAERIARLLKRGKSQKELGRE